MCTKRPVWVCRQRQQMTWLLVILVVLGAVGVMLGILAEGTNARRRARGT
jgi:hypothetical protein